MTNIEYHGLLKSVDENDNVKALYPKTYASDVIMSGGGY
jgi:hypothetical protein